MTTKPMTTERRNDLLALRRQDLRNAREFGYSPARIRECLKLLKAIPQVGT